MRTVLTYLALAAAPFTMVGFNTCSGGHAPDDAIDTRVGG
jgi:hypothetical protein